MENANIHDLVSDDFNSYTKTQDLIDETFKNQDEWVSKSITSVARMGFFTSGMPSVNDSVAFY